VCSYLFVYLDLFNYLVHISDRIHSDYIPRIVKLLLNNNESEIIFEDVAMAKFENFSCHLGGMIGETCNSAQINLCSF
jgi:hypothetical protein